MPGRGKLRAHEIRGRLQFAFQFGLLCGQQPMRTIEIIARAFDFADQRIGSEAGLHPRQDFLLARRFAEKIVGAARETLRNLFGLVVCGHEHDLAGP